MITNFNHELAEYMDLSWQNKSFCVIFVFEREKCSI